MRFYLLAFLALISIASEETQRPQEVDVGTPVVQNTLGEENTEVQVQDVSISAEIKTSTEESETTVEQDTGTPDEEADTGIPEGETVIGNSEEKAETENFEEQEVEVGAPEGEKVEVISPEEEVEFGITEEEEVVISLEKEVSELSEDVKIEQTEAEVSGMFPHKGSYIRIGNRFGCVGDVTNGSGLVLNFKDGTAGTVKYPDVLDVVTITLDADVCRESANCVNMEQYTIGSTGITCVQNYAKKGRRNYCATDTFSRTCCATTRALCFGEADSEVTELGVEATMVAPVMEPIPIVHQTFVRVNGEFACALNVDNDVKNMDLEFRNGFSSNVKLNLEEAYVMDGGKPSVCVENSNCENIEDSVIGFTGMSCVQNYETKGKLHFCSTNIITRACCETTKSICFGPKLSESAIAESKSQNSNKQRKGHRVLFYGFILSLFGLFLTFFYSKI